MTFRLARKLKNMKLSTKMVSIYIILTFIVVIFSLCALLMMAKNDVRRNSEFSIRSMVDKAQAEMDLKIEQIENVLSICAFRSELQNVYRNEYSSYYDRYYGIYKVVIPSFSIMKAYCSGDIETLRMYSLKGIKKNGEYLYPGSEARKMPWYDDAFRHNGILWVFSENSIYSVWRVDSIRTSDLEPLGILYCSLKMEDFINNYLNISWPSYHLSVSDDSGATVFERSFGDFSKNIEDRFLSYAFSWKQQGLTFTYVIPESTLTHEAYSYTVLRNSIFLLAGLMISAIVLVFMIRLLLRDVRMLKRSIDVIRAGSLDVDISSDSNDEIGQLANQFGEMVKDLKNMIEKEKASEKLATDLKLRVLRSQMDPHFLYNTLSRINWKAMRNGNMEIAEIVRALSAFYRASLNGGREITTVRNEIDIVNAYVKLQQMTHDSPGFDYESNVDTRALACSMPVFILQPFVENAIIHGIIQKKEGRGCLRVNAGIEKGTLVFSIEDDGPGLDGGENETDQFGHGISIVRQRLRLYYDDRFSIEYPPVARGCRVRISMPGELLTPENTNSREYD